jgi:hypothetical protein
MAAARRTDRSVGGERFSVYADFVQEQLKAEETRKTSLEQRGLAVITSSGVIATLGFGSLALAKRGDRIPLPAGGAFLLIAGALALLVAAALALATNAPLRHRAINLARLNESLREHAADDDGIALIRVTATRLGLLGTTRQGNDLKAILCLAAMVAEVLGVALLGATICVVLVGSR